VRIGRRVHAATVVGRRTGRQRPRRRRLSRSMTRPA